MTDRHDSTKPTNQSKISSSDRHDTTAREIVAQPMQELFNRIPLLSASMAIDRAEKQLLDAFTQALRDERKRALEEAAGVAERPGPGHVWRCEDIAVHIRALAGEGG